MHLLTAANVADYLRETGRVGPGDLISVQELAGGVSNVVLYISRPGIDGGDFVLKQARGQLRVEQLWLCSVERIWREVETLRICHEILSIEPEASAPGVLPGEDDYIATMPQVLWEDRESYAFAMSAAPPHRVWKTDLLSGLADVRIAIACGKLLGRLHGGTWRDPDVASRLADKTFFVDLRVDPYYRRVAEVHPELQSHLEPLIESVCYASLSLVHGDFSPKNLLVYEGGLMLVDCEVGHFGDPAFDLGFFLTHLALKTLLNSPTPAPYLALVRAFWDTYFLTLLTVLTPPERDDLARRAMANLAGCVLSRVDGKSPVEYLGSDRLKDAARKFGFQLFEASPTVWSEAEPLLREICGSLSKAAEV